MKNHVRVGVRAWNGASGALGPADNWEATLGCMWVEIDGERVPGQIVRCETASDAEDFATMQLTLIVSKYETVPFDADPVDKFNNLTRGGA